MSSFAIWKAYLLKAQKSHYFAVADPQWVPWANCTSHLLIMLPRCLLWSQLTCDRCRLSQHISREGWETKQKFTNGKLIFKNSKKNSLAKSPLLPRFWQCFHDLILYFRIFKNKFTVGKFLFGFPAFSVWEYFAKVGKYLKRQYKRALRVDYNAGALDRCLSHNTLVGQISFLVLH